MKIMNKMLLLSSFALIFLITLTSAHYSTYSFRDSSDSWFDSLSCDVGYYGYDCENSDSNYDVVYYSYDDEYDYDYYDTGYYNKKVYYTYNTYNYRSPRANFAPPRVLPPFRQPFEPLPPPRPHSFWAQEYYY